MPGAHEQRFGRVHGPVGSECGVPKNFADNVAVQYAHDANGECNTREE